MGSRADERGQEQAPLGIMSGKEVPYSRHGQERLLILLLSSDVLRTLSSASGSCITLGRDGKALIGKVER